MRKRFIYSLVLLFLIFSLGAGLTMVYIYRVTSNLQSVIGLHRIEIIRQNFVINTQTVQSNLYTTGTVFGKELDVIVDNVTALDESAHSCLSCHHSNEMTTRLKEVEAMVEQYKEAISYLITTTANPERVERLKMVAVGIGDSLLAKTQEMAFIADKNLNAKTVKALSDINNSKVILIGTLVLALFFALMTAVILTKQITEPVYALVHASRAIASGDLGYKTAYQDKTEFGELANNFNTMSAALKEEREKIDRYIGQLSGLYNITLSFYKLGEMEDAYKEICTHIADLLKVRDCILIFFDKTREMFVPYTSARGLDEDTVRGMTLSSQKMEELFKFSNGLPVIFNNPADYGRFDPISSDALQENSLLVTWLFRKEKILGAIRVSDGKGGFTDEDAKLLTILANHMAVAMENAYLYKSLQDQMVELRETQEQLIQSAKLAAIGELASNVAHEINNPLTSIIGFTELIKDENDLAVIHSRLDIIEKESMRARDIVRELLHFARKRPLRLEEVDINQTLDDVILLIEAQAKLNNVRVSKEYGELPKSMGDPNQLKQVFLNLINNAVSAMPEGGTLSLRTSQQGEYIFIRFKDTGHGIRPEVISRIFEPFFSTKKDKGTGLGLSISYRIIQDHGGRIDVESVEGQGSTFTIRIPIRSLKAHS
jgi:signal transduction histidine kinase/HAMP domain-containing protein